MYEYETLGHSVYPGILVTIINAVLSITRFGPLCHHNADILKMITEWSISRCLSLLILILHTCIINQFIGVSDIFHIGFHSKCI